MRTNRNKQNSVTLKSLSVTKINLDVNINLSPIVFLSILYFYHILNEYSIYKFLY